ncbi:hypothetical protein DFJ73DRAFT_935540 [Zopfochytrium polystomum]|nr:hypothetical protein DFJ73DRAFT_935540 [Zopfochytrium polystomum]
MLSTLPTSTSSTTRTTLSTVFALIHTISPMASTVWRPTPYNALFLGLSLLGGVRYKSKEPAIRLRPRHRKTASVRKGKKYKLKNHRGALTRWLLIRGGQFKRAQAGNHHLNRKNRAWKSRIKRRRARSPDAGEDSQEADAVLAAAVHAMKLVVWRESVTVG